MPVPASGFTRRGLLRLAGALGAGGLLPWARTAEAAKVAKVAAAAPAAATGVTWGTGPYESLGVKPLINCRGTLTVIGGSIELPEVRAAKDRANQQHVQIIRAIVVDAMQRDIDIQNIARQPRHDDLRGVEAARPGRRAGGDSSQVGEGIGCSQHGLPAEQRPRQRENPGCQHQHPRQWRTHRSCRKMRHKTSRQSCSNRLRSLYVGSRGWQTHIRQVPLARGAPCRPYLSETYITNHMVVQTGQSLGSVSNSVEMEWALAAVCPHPRPFPHEGGREKSGGPAPLPPRYAEGRGWGMGGIGG